MAFRKRLADIISPPVTQVEKTEELAKVVSLDEKVDLVSSLEERTQQVVPLEKLEKLYRVDGLSFRLVNKYIEMLVGPGFYFVGDEDLVKELTLWAEKIGLKVILENVVRDIYLAGNGWIEIGYNQTGNSIEKIVSINPRTGIDYLRDTNHNVILDEFGNPKGYKQDNSSGKIEWTKQEIKIGNEIKWTSTRFQDGRDRIGHFKLYSFGESRLGTTPLETVYKDALIRLNISDMVGEIAYRRQGLIATVKQVPGMTGEIPDKKIDKLSEELKNLKANSVFVAKENLGIGQFPTPDLSGLGSLLYYYADAQCSSFGIPLSAMMEGERGRASADLENKLIDFETTVGALQDRLAKQVYDNIILKYLKSKNYLNREIKFVFRSKMPSTEMSRARRISMHMRRGALRWDPELETTVRNWEGLPTSLVGKYSEEEKEKDKEVKPDREETLHKRRKKQ